jgi:hypothetical protein
MELTPGMTKSIVLCKRPTGMPLAEFKTWWLGPHTEQVLAQGGPEMRRVTYSFILEPGPGSKPWPNGEPPFDVISELWVDDRSAFDRTYGGLQSGGEMFQVVDHTSIRTPLIAQEYIVVDRMGK